MKFACFVFPVLVWVSSGCFSFSHNRWIGDSKLPVGMRTSGLRMDGLFWMICLVSYVCPVVLLVRLVRKPVMSNWYLEAGDLMLVFSFHNRCWWLAKHVVEPVGVFRMNSFKSFTMLVQVRIPSRTGISNPVVGELPSASTCFNTPICKFIVIMKIFFRCVLLRSGHNCKISLQLPHYLFNSAAMYEALLTQK